MEAESPPNILLICADQLHAGALSCAGDADVRTPHLDALAARGVRLERAHCTNPVCLASRFSLYTGLMPSAIGVRSNAISHLGDLPSELGRRGLGHRLAPAGYRCAYAGKVHWPKLKPADLGFEFLTHDDREGTVTVCRDFLAKPDGRPWLLAANLIQPHDIAHYALRAFATSEIDHFLVKHGGVAQAELDAVLACCPDTGALPPLPANHQPQRHEPRAVRKLLEQRPFRAGARDRWNDVDWRRHRCAYRRLTEKFDRQAGRILEALSASGQADRTVVIITSDHGDLDGAHLLEGKSIPYAEATRIPFLAAGPGLSRGGVDREHLVSNGLDLIPTCCDIAGVPADSPAGGRSVLPLLRAQKPAEWRTTLPIEAEGSRSMLTLRARYAVHDAAGFDEEELVDLVDDPGETVNRATDPDYAGLLGKMRHHFRAHYGAEPPPPAPPDLQ